MKDFEAFCCPIPYYGHDEEDRLRPQKPKVIKYFYGEYYECPNCKLMIQQHETKDTNYCKKCGQKFDWHGIKEEV